MRVTPSTLSIVVMLCAPVAAQDGELAAKDRAELIGKLTSIEFPGVPSPLGVFGEKAFVVAANRHDDHQVPIVAAARFGRGRIVVLPHNGFMNSKDPATVQFMVNCIRWAAGRRRSPIAVYDYDKLAAQLRAAGAPVQALDRRRSRARLANFSVIVVTPHDLTDREIAALRGFVEDGGGLVCGYPAWAWNANGQDRRDHFPGNKLFGPAGICWSSDYAQKPEGERIALSRELPEHLHATAAAAAVREQLESGSTGIGSQVDLELAAFTISRATQSVPTTDEVILPKLFALLSDFGKRVPIPSPQSPVRSTDALGRILVSLSTQRALLSEPTTLTAHPASATFPGAVSSDQRVSRTISVDTGIPRWHSTGLYAAPGETISVRVLGTRPRGLAIRIGAHKDTLWHKSDWRRVPEITRVFPVTGSALKAGSPFGGLVYVVVPDDLPSTVLQVTIENGVEAPYYVHGKTDVGDWRQRIRQSPAPWAELATDKFVLTVPSSSIRDLEFPDKLMDFWDEVLDHCADLATIPRQRKSPERAVYDVQISAGYLHAGYPIMGPTSYVPRVLDLPALRTVGDWGMYHEIGHNHQNRDWTWSGTGEVTVNLFSLYLLEKLNPKADLHSAIQPKKIEERLAKFQRTGDLGDPFTYLLAYMQLHTAFGWDAYKQVFAEYRRLPDEDRPKSDQDKKDQFCLRFSRRVRRDLTPWYDAWGIPLSDNARLQLAAMRLPKWEPGRFRPAK